MQEHEHIEFYETLNFSVFLNTKCLEIHCNDGYLGCVIIIAGNNVIYDEYHFYNDCKIQIEEGLLSNFNTNSVITIYIKNKLASVKYTNTYTPVIPYYQRRYRKYKMCTINGINLYVMNKVIVK